MKILLIDCDTKIEKALSAMGARVSVGTLGFESGERYIPVALYEQDIIVFNPSSVSFIEDEIVEEKEGKLYFPSIKMTGPLVTRDDMNDFFDKGGVFIVFYNPLVADIKKEMAIYEWLTNQIIAEPSNDRDLTKVMFPDDDEYIPFKSLLRDFTPKIPVERKLYYIDEKLYPRVLIKNIRNDKIAIFAKKSDGLIIALPTYEKNNDVIKHIVSYVYPQLYEIEPKLPKILDVKKSQLQLELEDERNKKQQIIDNTQKKIEDINSKIINETLRIEKLTTTDPTAVVILGYLNDILDDPKDSFHAAYKITEKLSEIYGGDNAAKTKLNINRGFNFIRRISNEAFRDTRHTPKQNEVIKPPTPEENKKLVENSIVIVRKYIEELTQ
ncbi:MAG TPA: hypothetical protein VMY36_01730 [Patescibacteria group bacterium]|nr:hypothetical protein [Patescibacteria group bacterium]